MIPNDAILSASSLKKNRRSIGLPGKFPTRWLVTTVFPSLSSCAKGSHVYSYFAEASVFHCLIVTIAIRYRNGTATLAILRARCRGAALQARRGASAHRATRAFPTD